MALSEDEIELLTAVRVADETRHREWFEDTLGVTIDLKALTVKKGGGPSKSGPPQSKIKVPLSHLIGAEAIASLIDSYKKRAPGGGEEAEDNPDVVQISNLPMKEAKALLKGMMQVASAEEHSRKMQG